MSNYCEVFNFFSAALSIEMPYRSLLKVINTLVEPRLTVLIRSTPLPLEYDASFPV